LQFATSSYQAPGIIPAGPLEFYRKALGQQTGYFLIETIGVDQDKLA